MKFYIWEVVSHHFAISLHPHNNTGVNIICDFWKRGDFMHRERKSNQSGKTNKYWDKDSCFMDVNLTHISTLCVFSKPKTNIWLWMCFWGRYDRITRTPKAWGNLTESPNLQGTPGKLDPGIHSTEQRPRAVSALKYQTIITFTRQKGKREDSSEYQLI